MNSDAENNKTENPPSSDPRPKELRTPKSLLLVHTGHGKGKSSSAFGVMIRGVAREWKVGVVQFIKSGSWHVGEEKIGRQLGVDWFALGEGFTWDSQNLDQDKKIGAEAWGKANELLSSGVYDLLIFDELTYLLNWNWTETQPVIEALLKRPGHTSVVVTGRDAPQSLIDIADTVTEMRSIKHAYENGFKAKRGIDY